MKQLALSSCLDLNNTSIVSFYGAGGKTTLLLMLAAELLDSGHKVLITTTTKIYLPAGISLFLTESGEDIRDRLRRHFQNSNIAVLGSRLLENNKLKGIDPAELGILRQELPVIILVEADGADGKPIKGYASYEPLLPAASSLIIPVLGGDALGTTVSTSTVHRPILFTEQTGIIGDSIITEEIIANHYDYMLKLGKAQAPEAETAVILNKYSLINKPGTACLSLANRLADKKITNKLLVTEGKSAEPVKMIFNLGENQNLISVACIVLAAGESSRMGTDKLALLYNGKAILEHTLDNIIASGLKDITVVTAPESKHFEMIKRKKGKIAVNPLFETGQASSLKTGLVQIDSNTQGVLIALADQPLVSPSIYQLLLANYQNKLRLVTAPLYKGERGNPTLFDRRCWPKLGKIDGDKGGRAIINYLREDELDFVEVGDISVISDIDTPEDYELLKSKPSLS